jgi:hypothetical protein
MNDSEIEILPALITRVNGTLEFYTQTLAVIKEKLD